MPSADQWKEFEKCYDISLGLIGELNKSLEELDKLVVRAPPRPPSLSLSLVIRHPRFPPFSSLRR